MAATYDRLVTEPVTILYKHERTVYADGPNKGKTLVEWTKKRFLGSSLKTDDFNLQKADLRRVVEDGADSINTTHYATLSLQLPYVQVDGDSREQVLSKPFATKYVRDAGGVGAFWFTNGKWAPTSNWKRYPFDRTEPPPWTELYYTSRRGYSEFEVLEGKDFVAATAIVPTQAWIEKQKKAIEIEEAFDMHIESLKEWGNARLPDRKMVEWRGAYCNEVKGTGIWSFLYGDKEPGVRTVYTVTFRWKNAWQYDGGELERVLGAGKGLKLKFEPDEWARVWTDLFPP